MAAKSSFRNMVICLTAVCLVCGSVLAAVYAVTYEPIKASAEKAEKAAISEVLPAGCMPGAVKSVCVGETEYEYYEASEDGAVKAYAVKSAANGFGGKLLLMVGVLEDGTVWATKVLSQSETPGLGAKCATDEAFMAQWSYEKRQSSGKKLEVLAVSKDGGDVDAITASTITSRAYTLAVSQAVNVVESLRGEAVEAVSGASVKSE